jgi:hypothetical protein
MRVKFSVYGIGAGPAQKAVSTVITLGTGRSSVRIPAKKEDFFFSETSAPFSDAYPVFYLMVTGNPFPMAKTAVVSI